MASFMMMMMMTPIWLVALISVVNANVIRCNLIDPHTKESELCWKQLLLYKVYLRTAQETATNPGPVRVRNAELSSALMQLYGNKFNGKRNPEFAGDWMKYVSDVERLKEN